MTRHHLLRRLLVPATIGLLSTACSLDFDEFADPASEPDITFLDDSSTDTGPVADATVDAALDVTVDAANLDQDGDGVNDAIDNCPEIPNPGQEDQDEDGEGDACETDRDGDGVEDEADNCPELSNPDQLDLDRDALGDVCDDDLDGDGLLNDDEAAQGTNPRLADSDGDGLADGTDTCPVHPDRTGVDRDGDGAGDACDPDNDGDGVVDYLDNCPGTPNADQAEICANDFDGDGVSNAVDNCPTMANPDQGIAPCESAFEVMTYVRDAHAMVRFDGGVLAGTSGGVITVEGAETRVWTNADGLGGNRIRGAFVDSAQRRWLATDGGVVIIRADGFVFNLNPLDVGGGPQGDLRDVLVTDDGVVWVSSDQGLNQLSAGVWSLLDGEPLPSPDVRGLHLDDLGRLWIATASGVVRVANGQFTTLAGLPDVGAVNAAVSVGDETWIFGEDAAVLIGPDDMPVPHGLFPDLVAYDIATVSGGRTYLATAQGVQRLDAPGRLMPSSHLELPGTAVRAVTGAVDVDPWLATDGGVVQLGGYFASFDGETLGSECVTSVLRDGDRIWIGTDAGVTISTPGVGFVAVPAAGLPSPEVSVIRKVGEEIWVGTNAGIGVFDLTGAALEILRGSEGLPVGPISDIVPGIDGGVWVATNGAGIARRPAGEPWEVFSTANAGNNFRSDDTKALAHDGEVLWIATPLGLQHFDEATSTFGVPIIANGGRLPDNQIHDVVAVGGEIFVATRLGLGIRDAAGSWSTYNQAAGSWSADLGTNAVQAVAHDGTYLWIWLAENQRQPTGSLLRRDAAGEISVFTAANAGLVPSGGIDGLNLEITGGDLGICFCGDAVEPGGLSLLDDAQVVVRDDLAELGVPGAGVSATLTRDMDGHPLFVSIGTDGMPQAVSVLGQHQTTPLALPPGQTARPLACDASDEENAELWCVLEDTGVARRFPEGSWSVLTGAQISAFNGHDINDIAVGSNLSVWVATSNGITFFDSGTPRALTVVTTEGGLPSDDVRAITLGADGALHAATAAGVGIQRDGQWTAIGEGLLPNLDARAIAAAPTGETWVGTSDGLFKINGEEVTAFYTADGLPTSAINAVAVTADGEIIVGTDAGLAMGPATGPFSTIGFVDGLPGSAVYEIMIEGDAIWVRSDDGIAKLQR